MIPFMADEQGLRVILTPVQLSAVLHGEQVHSQESAANRFWGAAKVVGGALELLGAGGLLAVPEPTMLTKAAGGVLGVHGLDTLQAGAREVWTGEPTKTLTQQGGEAIAYELGASKDTAEKTGVVVDIVVPIVVASIAVAVRLAAVRAGRIVLLEEEAAGGHTLLKHVGQSEAALRARLAAQTGIKAASSFGSVSAAESVISDAVKANAAAIRTWSAAGNMTRFRVIFDAGKDIGYGVVRATGKLTQMQKVLIVLESTTQNGKLYFILTAYPIL